MRPQEQLPQETVERDGIRLNHPAFGSVVVTHSHGGNERMFGSELKHNSRITIAIHEAYQIRSCSVNRQFSSKLITELSFTETQWASFVSSVGRDCGTPCTLEHVRTGTSLERLPTIAGEPDPNKTFRDEMLAQITARLTKIDDQIAKVNALVEAGKANKGQLKEILDTLQTTKTGLKNNVSFIMDQFTEHMEEKTSEAKSQIEAFVSNYAKELGFEAMKGKTLMLDTGEDTHE